MNLPFKPASTIGNYARRTVSWNDDRWLYFKKGDEVSLNTECFLQDWDSRDLSPEEQDQLDDRIDQSEYRLFLLWSQLNDIVQNLKLQKSDYTDDDLDRAIIFYWHRDAFIDIQSCD